MSDTPKTKAPRRIRRHAVVPMFHVNGRPFDSRADADLWSDVLHRAEQHVANTKPELSDKRAETLALDMAEAMFAYGKESADSEEPSRDSGQKSGSVSTPTVPKSEGLSNGASPHHG